MHTFFCAELSGDNCLLDESESNHCVKVLRLQEGAICRLIDGNGTVAEGELIHPHAKSAGFKIKSKKTFEKPKSGLTIAIAPTKNIDRFEFFLEKAVELGVSRVIPLRCNHSERKNIRHDRAEKAVLAATKQSMRAFLPLVDDLTQMKKLPDLIDMNECYIAHCEESEKVSIHQINAENNPCILIGPEGDFSPEEIKWATDLGAKALDLGTNRLRTETAGIFAVAAILKNAIQC
jgi:16S rRNA (uracil1498-N3)-methyltransferase